MVVVEREDAQHFYSHPQTTDCSLSGREKTGFCTASCHCLHSPALLQQERRQREPSQGSKEISDISLTLRESFDLLVLWSIWLEIR